ncbi:DEAD/DEAH box helicase family protein [Polyangium sp. 15x6]|uniref:DEAD/DEAH box helicase family protein n=1 Tax=Polyangium sp. 15x6 TaxID=3042687 RepID=UPI00249B5D04|nr:DEAD/DEAH box helicase family protein [Polyangium sp. 15x6]MDI3282135.1 DEAD/DEAH box helicase family protein [Polyangium sp. 15x6]
MSSSPFLRIPSSSWLASNPLAFAVPDLYPVSRGHTLVIPRRLIATWFEATAEERVAIFDLVDDVKRKLDAELHPDGYNIGINAGEAAGQTVMHLHVHVIPRYRGDIDDPRGGVRHVIPGKGNYLENRPPPLAEGGKVDPFLLHLDPLFRRATDIAILAAFVQQSGVSLLQAHVAGALSRGARVRVVTGDYLNITQSEALAKLRDWMDAWEARIAPDGSSPGAFEARVVETARLPEGVRSFHPKSWRFEGPDFGTAFVGSSNLSHAALHTGVEWNLRVDRHRDRAAYQAILDAYERWWTAAVPLTADWIADYTRRAREAPVVALPPGEEDDESKAPPLEPHPVQREALAALAQSRAEGRNRALCVLATGLGKTWLAAFDVTAFAEKHGNRPRVLLLAHREELLLQAAATFRRQLRDARVRFGWFVGDRSDLGGDILFASVQKLSRPEHLARLTPDAFDYVIVDEVHHGTAPSYRSIIDRLNPRFLLGLTATPERADGADVAGLFDDHVAYQADLGIGIQRKLLVPFTYFGLKDDTDYENVPFRNRRFAPEALEQAIDTDARLQRMFRAWQEHPGQRTLVFCGSIRHADHASGFLTKQGIRAAAVHSGPTSAARDSAIAALVDGTLDALCTVDLFNEGIDIPTIDRVVMLRPTESPVVFLQQLGRGLRFADGKTRLVVLDFVGNHRVFLERVRTLLSLGPEPTSLRDFLESNQAARMAPGCTIDLELEAKDLLAKLLPPQGGSPAEQAYRDLREVRGERPLAGELYRMGYSLKRLRDAHGGFFDFVAAMGDLDEMEKRVLDVAGEFLRELEITAMSKCYKMVTLEALLEADALRDGLPVFDLAQRSHAIMARSPELLRDLSGVADFPDVHAPDVHRFATYWRINPIAAWTSGPGKRFFAQEGDRFVSRIPCPPGGEKSLSSMVRELVDYRLAMYRARQTENVAGVSFSAKVLWNKRDPILKLPTHKDREELPRGETTVRLPDGTLWLFRFMKEYCNVARPVGSHGNELPDLLRRWFGLAAGRPGTNFRVRFSRSPSGLWVEPDEPRAETDTVRGLLLTFPTLRAAAGSTRDPIALAPEGEQVRLPTKARGEGLFAVRATGDSMNGGKEPIRDGDWLVMRFARSASRNAIEGKIALVEVPDSHLGASYLVKRIVRDGKRWILRSENPAHASIEAAAEIVPIATLVEVVKPEAIGPEVGANIEAPKLAEAFGLPEPPRTGRVDGHLFLLVEEKGRLVAPDRIRFPGIEPRPGETAFVLTRADGTQPWRHAGVARFVEDDGAWACGGIDHPTFRALGEGREASRTLPRSIEDRARRLVEALLREKGSGSIVERDGKRLRLVGPAKRGGVRIDGGPGGFEERTVSLTDIGWVLVALSEVNEDPRLLQEELVHHVRYLEGTPKGSTRYIDTGWAMLLVKEAFAAKA